MHSALAGTMTDAIRGRRDSYDEPATSAYLLEHPDFSLPRNARDSECR